MDKDVKRSILLWPIIASTAIIASTTLPLWWHKQARQAAEFSAIKQSLSMVVHCGEKPLAISDSALAESLRASVASDCAAHRPDRGVRGLALPSRLMIEEVLGETLGDENGVSSSASADLAASSKVIARTLLAPVLDPVAELAGFSGLASEGETNRRASSTPPFCEPKALVALPSSLSPGLDDPFTATGRGHLGNAVATCNDQWMLAINPVATAKAIAIGDALASEPACLNQPSKTLIPQSVAVLARPIFAKTQEHPSDPYEAESTNESKTAPRTFKIVGNAWPQPKQLYRDLALIAADADVASLATSANRQSFASVQLPSSSSAIVRELISEGNLQQFNGHDASPLHRYATALVMGRWADKVGTTIDELQALPRIGDERSGQLIRELAALSEAGLQMAERVPVREQQIRWLRAAHACSRRSAIWGPIWRLARNGEETQYVSLATSNGENLAPPIEMATLVGRVRAELNQTGDEAGWDRFLLLDEIESASKASNADERSLVAQRFLSRLDHHLIRAEHREWLSRDSIRALAESLQIWTVRPIDYKELLEDLERGETDSIDLSAIKVGEVFQSLRFSQDLAAVKVAKAIDLNYRNANVRTAISVQLIDRLLPEVPSKVSPIRTRLLGNDVRGTSRTESQIGIRLNPSEDSWNLSIQTLGDVLTESYSGQSGVTVLTNGQNVFDATTPLIIGADGYRIGETHVAVTGSQLLRGVRSKYDGWPLIGSLVRGIAESRFEEARPLAIRASQRQIEGTVTEELQTQLNAKASQGQNQLDEFVFGPLGRLNLEPKVIDLETTSDRLVARYRLAGDWQLASNTPRPRAWSDSWMSLQIHQSAFNNTFEQLLPKGNAKTLGDFFQDTMALFGRDNIELPDDVPADARIEFAATRPITVEMDEGRLTLTLRVVSLSQDDGTSLKRFIVRADYRPEIDGLSAKLVRDGHLSVSGPGMSMRQRFPIRALFNKILSESRTIPLTMPRLVEHPAAQDLAISQLEMRDGWLALAISPNTSPRVAVGTRVLVGERVMNR
ncbi:hypothetical protein [Neorhodopirellula pilleata]|uniref:Uncharacterized protein n=1 Tax=Neorhodopirellula pilleata TaxID=2714738 RepID=A0A5C6ASL4_9BACT|nr:hypothetical protein [Neorhodopirellula pilleata]TWU02056.1 hypothetical protein Pla100_17950 [Neorhodopirellula pilleata]